MYYGNLIFWRFQWGQSVPRLVCWTCIPLSQESPWGWHPGARPCASLTLVRSCILGFIFQCIFIKRIGWFKYWMTILMSTYIHTYIYTNPKRTLQLSLVARSLLRLGYTKCEVLSFTVNLHFLTLSESRIAYSTSEGNRLTWTWAVLLAVAWRVRNDSELMSRPCVRTCSAT